MKRLLSRPIGGSAAAGSNSPPAPITAPLGALVACGLLVLMQLYVSIPLTPVVEEELPGGGASAALATTFGLAYAAGFVVFGPISDQYGRKVVLVPGVAALAVTTAAVALAPSLAVLAGLRALQGLSAATFAAVALAYVTEALPQRWRNPGVGMLQTAFLAAGIVGQVYAATVAAAWDWRVVFALAAAGFALAAPALAFILREPVRSITESTLAHRYRQFARLLGRRDLVLTYLATCTLLFAFVAMYSALEPLLSERFGLDSGGVQLVRLAGLPGMLLAPLAGALVARLGAVRVVVAGFATAALGLAAEAILSDVLAGLVLASVAFVSGVAITAPALVAVVASRAGDEIRAGAIALYGFALFAGASLGPLAAQTGLGFEALLLALAAVLAAGAGLVLAGTRSGAPKARV